MFVEENRECVCVVDEEETKWKERLMMIVEWMW